MATEHRKELAALSGPAFDKAYLDNEISYYLTVTGTLEVTMLPSVKNQALKELMDTRLKILKAHLKNAEALKNNLK